MKKRLSLFVGFILVHFSILAQDSHIFSRYSSQPERTENISRRIDSIPYFKPTKSLKSSKNITYIDNSKLMYFPSVFNQSGNSCSQASGIRNVFTYEMNYERNLSATSSSNVYSYHYTWNFLNNGQDNGTWYFDGFSLVQDNGAPSINDFPDESGQVTLKTWMSGYDKYYRAMKNRIESYSKVDAGADDGLALIKQYLIDHGNGSSNGGVIVFSGNTAGWDMFNYSGTRNTDYSYAIRTFGNGGPHAMTIVGFDDDVSIDVNNDGIIQDDEKGALIFVNSWGTGWGSNGRAYMSYKLLKMNWNSGGIGNGDHDVYMIKAKNHSPKVTAKITINYTSRNDLWIILGIAKESAAENQERTKTIKIFKKQGGDYYMRGTTDESGKTIEIGLDFSDLIESIPDAEKFFITLKQSIEGSLGEGKVVAFSILDYRNSSSPVEYICPDKNVNISGSPTLKIAMSSTRIDYNQDYSGLNIYPNPVRRGESITIMGLSESNDDLSIKLINNLGQIVKWDNINTVEVSNDNYNFSIPSELKPGVYFIQFQGSRLLTKSILVYK